MNSTDELHVRSLSLGLYYSKKFIFAELFTFTMNTDAIFAENAEATLKRQHEKHNTDKRPNTVGKHIPT